MDYTNAYMHGLPGAASRRVDADDGIICRGPVLHWWLA
jgi:hypothetical protein